ncbi:MAG: DUF995 domain-containing protein [Sulfitobacter sp.]
MKIFSAGLVAAAILACAPIAASADPKPLGAKVASASQIARAYAGKTDLWDADCSGGIYYGGSAQARAWCAEKGNNLGAGTWSTDNNGNMCYKLKWYWPNGNRAGSSTGETSCISHVVDAAGRVWRSWPGDSEWWLMRGSSSMVRGYKFQDEVRRTQNRLGL